MSDREREVRAALAALDHLRDGKSTISFDPPLPIRAGDVLEIKVNLTMESPVKVSGILTVVIGADGTIFFSRPTL